MERFTNRHGTVSIQCEPDAALLHAEDGAQALLVNRWQPLPSGPVTIPEVVRT